LTQGFLDLASAADIDGRNDDAVDLVVDGPVRTQAHVVPLASPAFYSRRHEEDEIATRFCLTSTGLTAAEAKPRSRYIC
jgi:hypothetical protein